MKWGSTAIVSAFTFMSPLSSSMIAPASDQLAGRFGETNTVIIAMYTSIFVLAYGAFMTLRARNHADVLYLQPSAPSFSALSASFTAAASSFNSPTSSTSVMSLPSRSIRQLNLFHPVWNFACGFARNTPEFLIFRFLAGLGGSAPLSVCPSHICFLVILISSSSLSLLSVSL